MVQHAHFGGSVFLYFSRMNVTMTVHTSGGDIVFFLPTNLTTSGSRCT